MIMLLVGVGLACAVLLFGIFRRLGEIHEVVASIYVHGSLSNERELRESQAKEGQEVLEGKKLLMPILMTSVNELAFARDTVSKHFRQVDEQLQAGRDSGKISFSRREGGQQSRPGT